MKKNCILKTIFAFCIQSIFFISCSDNITFNDEPKNEPVAETFVERAYITVSVKADADSRMVFPQSYNLYDYSYVLKGKKDSQDEYEVLDIWERYIDLRKSSKLEISEGLWEFVLEASMNNEVILTSSLTKRINFGNNTLSFLFTETGNGKGNLNISFYYPAVEIEKITAVLFDLNDVKVSGLETLIPVKSNGKYKVVYNKNELEKGTYILRFYLYQNESDSSYTNTYSLAVRIASGRLTSSEEEIEKLNSIYSINYELNEGQWVSAAVVPLSYISSLLTEIPYNICKEGTAFAGWYESPDCSGERVTVIPSGTYGNKTFYAKWSNSVTYSVTEAASVLALANISNAGDVVIHITDENPDLDIIKDALLNSDVNVDLDLSACAELTEIGDGIFSDCLCLTDIILPESVTSIGEGAFNGCENLKEIILPAGVTDIGKNAFSGCSNITEITISEGVTTIGESAFSGCSSLESITIPESVTSIGEKAFSGCSSLESIVIPFVGTSADAVAADETTLFGYIFGDSAYEGCTAVRQYYDSDSYADYYIPDSLRKVEVTGGNILYGSFSNCEKLTEIKLPDTVTDIGEKSFCGCSSLSSITIPESVTSIGKGAFSDCLPDFVYIESMESWMNISFEDSDANPCRKGAPLYIDGVKVSEFIIPDGITSIGEYVFCGMNLSSVIIPETVTDISAGAFSNCKKLKSITIPESVTSIGEYTFAGCLELKDIILPDGVTDIGESAFIGCSSLESIIIPKSITVIKKNMFENCLFKCITIPETVTAIEEMAFAGCSCLKSIVIPESVTSIGKAAFSGCSSLESMEIPFVGGSADAVTADKTTLFGYIFGDSAYEGGTKVTQYYDSYSYTYFYTDYYADYYIPDTLRKVKVSGGNILCGAFSNCENLTEIKLPDTITDISVGVFHGCSSLTTITMSEGVTSIGAESFAYCSSLKSVTIPESVTSIGQSAFYRCGIKTITIPDGVTVIEFRAFSECSSLTSVTLPEGVTSIGVRAFDGCSSLESITIPESVTNIGDAAFIRCEALESVHIESMESWMNISFEDPSSNPLSDGADLYIKGVRVSDLVIPDGITSIGNYVFCGMCFSTVIIPDGVTTIEVGAFSECSKLTSITIPETVTSIGQSAFFGCHNLSNVKIPETVTSIGAESFAYCSSLESITIPESVTNIGESAFKSCDSLTTITMSEGVTSIGVRAFEDCSSLESITIPESVTNIGKAAFSGCTSLESMVIPFVGGFADKKTADETTLFGYIFGESEFYDCSETKQWCVTGNGERITKTYYIPSRLHEVEVTGSVIDILCGAFSNCSELQNVRLYGNVINIGDSAFCNCGLSSIGMAWNCCDTIGKAAFSHCENLTEIKSLYRDTIGGVTFMDEEFRCKTIGKAAFLECPNLSKIERLECNTIGDEAFLRSGLTEINGLHCDTIGTGAFYECSKLSKIERLACNTIGDEAFKECYNLKTVNISDCIVSIGAYAFYECPNIERVHSSATLKRWIMIDFENEYSNPCCYGAYLDLQEDFDPSEKPFEEEDGVKLPDDIESIGKYAFCGCKGFGSEGLEGIYISEHSNLRHIGEGAFLGSSIKKVYMEDLSWRCVWRNISFDDSYSNPFNCGADLYIYGRAREIIEHERSIEIYEGITGIGEDAFEDVSELREINLQTVKRIGKGAFSGCSGLQDVYLPEVEEIGENAFKDCLGLRDINLQTVKRIGKGAFSGCSSLERITLDTDSDSRPLGYIFGETSYDGGVLTRQYYGPGTDSYVDYYIPASLKYVSVYSSKIPYGAFSGCAGLKGIALLGVRKIEENAFKDCSGLEAIYLSENLSEIGEDAFYGCSNLTGVEYSGTETQWQSVSIASGNDALQNATIVFQAPY